MAIHKLKNAGEELTLDIASVDIVPSTDAKVGNQVKFTDANGDDLYVGESAVIRQLDRCGVAEIADLAGRAIHFSRAANKNPAFSPYWNLDKAQDGDKKPAPASNGKPPVAGKPEGMTVGKLPGDDEEEAQSDGAKIHEAKCKAVRDAHARAFAHVVNHYVPLAAENGVELSLEGVSALTFQLFKAQQDAR